MEGVDPELPEGFENQLLACVARVISLAGDSDLFFLGRSPESLFDLASGLLHDSTWRERAQLLPLSLPPPEHFRAEDKPTFRRYFKEVGIDPPAIASRQRPAAFIDLVSSGGTFDLLFSLLREWCAPPVDWRSIARKVRIVGVIASSDWGATWDKGLESLHLLPPRHIKSVSIRWKLWDYLADRQPKMSVSYGPWAWRDPSITLPRRDPQARAALAAAVHLFELGRDREMRRAFASLLAGEPTFRASWLRSLALELKR